MDALNSNAFFSVIGLIVNLYLFILILRLMLQKFEGPYYNPISQFVVKVTAPILKPLQRYLPVYHGFDSAIIIAALILIMLINIGILWLKFAAMPNLLGILLLAIAMLADKAVTILFFAIIVDVLVSWVPALLSSPVTPIAHCIANPLLKEIRRFVPFFAGMDFSPLVALLLLKALSIVIIYPLQNMGLSLALQGLIR